MTINILAFGIVKEIFGASSIQVELSEATVHAMKNVLEERFPKLKQLASYMVAVNNEYATAVDIITANDEIAIIPPVSGG